jgi:putative ubiquitin-RnfH superfamily antitoxin RatB of RatAB toxin-antitoxin module
LSRKRCVVAYATRERQYLWTVELPVEATIADALVAAQRMAEGGLDGQAPEHEAQAPEVLWETAPVGIFGQLRTRSDVPADGDRIEVYRPLHSDPRERRRERVQTARKTQKSKRS